MSPEPVLPISDLLPLGVKEIDSRNDSEISDFLVTKASNQRRTSIKRKTVNYLILDLDIPKDSENTDSEIDLSVVDPDYIRVETALAL